MKDMPRTEEEWKKRLTPEEYEVMRKKGTERSFTGAYVNEHAKGVYRCKGCGTELFSSDAKFDSGTGWPSFTEPANLEHVELKDDASGGMRRTEVLCKKCGAHLGHVFDDLPRLPRFGEAGSPRFGEAGRSGGKAGGPKEQGGKRYCINSVCLELEKKI